MKLTYFQGNPTNFGDELNSSIWSHLLPEGLLDDDPSELFLGIGSIIQNLYPAKTRKIVMGAGYARYTEIPDVHDGTWDIHFVRGPRSAELLGIDPKLVIADAAILLRETPMPTPAQNIGTAFMPHYESLERGNWRKACEIAGIYFIDPTENTDKILSEILGADMLITEAMHGAIVADALRTPWIGIKNMHPVHRFKWHDWADALNIKYRPVFQFPSNGRECWSITTGRSGTGPGARAVFGSKFAQPINATCLHIAARSLQKIAKNEPQLSADHEISRATERAMEAVELFANRP